MKLHFSPQSPFTRKVMIVAHEVNCVGQIETVVSAAHPVQRNPELVAHNPLGQIPALELGDGRVLCDSRVICEFLDSSFGGAIYPASGPERWQALTNQSLGDGMLAGALLARYETAARPAELQWPDWRDSQLDKSSTCLAAIERDAVALRGRVDIGTITIACALGYLDLRFPDFGWRRNFPGIASWAEEFGQRPSLAVTRPV